jgi:hypothetical protein
MRGAFLTRVLVGPAHQSSMISSLGCFLRHFLFKEEACDSMTAFTSLSRSARGTNSVSIARQTQPPAVVLDEPSCYHFRILDPPPGYMPLVSAFPPALDSEKRPRRDAALRREAASEKRSTS